MTNGFKGQVDRVVRMARSRQTLLTSLGAGVVVYALLGFFLVPWLVRTAAIDLVRNSYGAELRIRKVAVNPFVLSLRVEGLEMDDPAGATVARVEQLYINFQLSSMFRWALTFAEFRLDAPELFLARDKSGELNLSFLTEMTGADENRAEPEGGSRLRLIVQDFSVNDATTHWSDAVPPEPVVTTLGPVNVQVLDLNTLPGRPGRQQVVITTETSGTFSWNGSLQLNPLYSQGHASVQGSHFPLVSRYVRDAVGFEAVRGNVDAGLDFTVGMLDDGSVQLHIDNFALALTDLLVRTYDGRDESAEDGGDRDLVQIPRLRIDRGTVRWPDRTASLGLIAVDDGVLSIYRNHAGALNIVPAASDEQASGGSAPPVDVPPAPQWALSLDRMEVSHMSVGLVDDSVNPQANVSVQDIMLVMSGINNTPAARFPVSLSMGTRAGGSITAKGTVGILAEPVADLALAVDGFALSLLQPYIKPLADVSLDKGVLELALNAHSGPGETLSLAGDITIDDLLITETDEGSTLGSWDRVTAHQVALSLSSNLLEVSELRLDKPYADILIAEDGTANLGRVAPGSQSAEQPEPGEEATAPADPARPLEVVIGHVVVNDAAADFADRSLPLPFDAKIAALNGSMTTIATASNQPSEIALEGRFDEYGLVQVSGTVTPLQPALNTDIRVRFQNAQMPKFSAYSVPFAGREIASGKLDLDLGYQVRSSVLVGENRIVMRDFELGDRVEHPGALSLPLGLAVALLKDSEGKIDVELPVRGNVDDPEFRYGRVFGQAIASLIGRIVAAPFTLLGRLVGMEANELEYTSFLAGRADLTPPEQEKMVKLADALAQRPELKLVIRGVIDREADGLAMRTSRLDALVDERIGALQSADGADARYVQQRTRMLEEMYKESALAEQPDAVLTELRARFTVGMPVEGTAKPESAFDEPAYAAELRRRLIDSMSVVEDDFAALAAARAESVRSAVVGANADLQGRIAVGRSEEVQVAAGEPLRMRVVLAAAIDRDT